MKYFNRVWRDFRQGENIDLYLTVLISIIVTILNIIGLAPSTWIAPLNLAILALLSVSILGNRYKTESVLEKISSQNERLLVQFPQDPMKDMEKSTELTLVGVDLRQTLHRNFSLFQKKLIDGQTIKLLIIDPDSPACEIAAMRYYAPMSTNSQRDVIRASLDICNDLTQKTSGKLEVRLAEHPLTFGAIMSDPETSHGVVYIWHYSFKMSEANIPKMVFRPTDGFWYEFFQQEMNSMWNAAKPWNAKAPS